jgi:uncharacterized protein YjaZ
MLEGYDKQWVQAGTNRSVTYNNLPAGTYTFKVKAANSSGVWEEKGDSHCGGYQSAMVVYLVGLDNLGLIFHSHYLLLRKIPIAGN